MPLSSPAKGPTVSVVMANKNGGKHLEQAVHSVMNQSLQSIELVFVDDASTDDSLKQIRRVAGADPRIRIIARQVSQGAAAARNDAIARIQSDWIAICDSDDVMHPERLDRLLAFAKRKQACLVADDCIHFSQTPMSGPKTVLGLEHDLEAQLLTPLDLAQNSAIGYLKPLIKRSILPDHPYREDLAIGEDYQLYLDLVLKGAALWLCPTAQYLYRRQPGSLSFRSYPDQIAAQIAALRDAAVGSHDAQIQDALAARIGQLQQNLAQESFALAVKHKRIDAMCKLALAEPGPIWSWSKRFLRSRLARATSARAPQNRQTVILDPPTDKDGNAARKYFAELCYQASLGDLELIANHETTLSAAWMVPAASRIKHDHAN